MNQIADFVQVRADGKLVPSALTVKEMSALGWEPSKVIALKWHFGEKETIVQVPNGVHGIVVPGANFVAALYAGDEANPSGSLAILFPDGTLHGEVSNHILLSGVQFSGAYRWFEPALSPGVDTIGVVFQAEEDASLRCDVDARRLLLTTVVKIQ